MIPTFATGVVHKVCPERDLTMGRLRGQLVRNGLQVDYLADKPAKSFHDWSLDVWHGTLSFAKEHGRTHLLLLNDDVILHERFGELLTQAVTARPGDVIGLHQPHHKFAEVKSSWGTSYDGLVGPAHVWPVPVFEDFLEFREECFLPAVRETLDWPEDAQQATFLLATRQLVYHPVPAIIDMDLSVRSNYGHDGDPYARPWVRADENSTWDFSQEPQNIGLCYRNYNWSLVSHLTRAARRKYSGIERAYELAQYDNGERQPYKKEAP